MKKLILASSFTLLSAYSSLSSAQLLPENCHYQESPTTVNLDKVYNAVEKGLGFHNDPDTITLGNVGSFLFSLASLVNTSSEDDFKLTGPDHVLRGVPTEFRGDMKRFAFGKINVETTLNFLTSESEPFRSVFLPEEGRYILVENKPIQKDTDQNADAKVDLTFHHTYGLGMVASFTGGQRDQCRSKSVWIQNRPTIEKNAFGVRVVNGAENTVEASVEFGVDTEYSKAAIAGTNPIITFNWVNESGISGRKSVSASDLTGNITTTLTNVSGGFVRFYASVYDGNFHGNVILGEFDVPGKRTKKPCETGVGGKRCQIDL